jgi:hypothetical protein
MSDNPLIEGFLKLHEAGGIGGGMSGTKFSNAANYAPAVGAGVRGAFNNVTMDAGKYARAAADYTAKNLGSLARMSEPTTYDKEIKQEIEKDTAAKRDFPDAYKTGEIGSTAAQALFGAGAVAAALRAGIRPVAKNTGQTIAKNADAGDFNLGMQNALNLTPQMRVPTTPLNLTPQMRVPATPLNLTPQMRVPKLRTEEENDSSKGNNEMSTNPYIKGFFDIEEARAKNTNIFDESKKLKLTPPQKKLDKNDNDKIDAEDFEMLRKEKADLDEAKKAKPGHNASVMTRNISNALKAVKPDKEESMKKAAADKKKESDLDEAVTDEHRERALATINARISKPGQPPKHPTYDGAPKDIKDAVDNLAKMYAESVDLEEKAKWRSSSAAKKITDPNNPDLSLADYDYHYENPRSTGRLQSTADTKLPYGSINNRRESNIKLIGKRKGMISKADINRVKSNAFNALKKEEVDLDEVSQELATRAYGRRSRDAAEYGDSGDDKEMNKSYDKGQKTLSIIKKKYGQAGADKANQQSSGLVYGGKKPYKEEVEFSEEEIDFINNVMEAMPVAPTSENDSPNPTPKKNAEGSRAKGSMAD